MLSGGPGALFLPLGADNLISFIYKCGPFLDTQNCVEVFVELYAYTFAIKFACTIEIPVKITFSSLFSPFRYMPLFSIHFVAMETYLETRKDITYNCLQLNIQYLLIFIYTFTKFQKLFLYLSTLVLVTIICILFYHTFLRTRPLQLDTYIFFIHKLYRSL